MPWRKRGKLLDQLVDRLKQDPQGVRPLSSLQILGMVELMAEQIRATVRAIAVLVFVLFVVQAGQAIVSKINADNTHSNQRTIAHVQKVIDDAVRPDQPAAKASQDAIVRIRRIEFAVCGGPCPTTPEETKTK